VKNGVRKQFEPMSQAPSEENCTDSGLIEPSTADDPLLLRKPGLSFWSLFSIALGFGSDAYNIFIMNVIILVLQSEYPNWDRVYFSFITGSVIIGIVLGQVIFGRLADRFGRTQMFLVTMGIIALFSTTSAAAPEMGKHHIGLVYWLVISRFLLGLGIGGEYPLSATITAQLSTKETMSRNMGVVICAQGVGNLIAAAFCVVLVFSNVSMEWVWRGAFLFPLFLCLLTAYPRYMLSEVARATEPPRDAVAPTIAHTEPFWKHGIFEKIAEHKLTLLGTAGSWFLFDISFYGNSLFNASVMKILHFNGDPLHQTVLFSLVVAAIGLPGYVLAVMLSDRLGRKNIQMIGFMMMAIIFTIMGAGFKTLSHNFQILFVILYGLTFFFSNFGPNVTTYTITGEVFPDEISATCFGISAACGKLGALLGTLCFDLVKNAFGVPTVFGICAGLSVLGFLLTLMVTKPDKMIREEPIKVN